MAEGVAMVEEAPATQADPPGAAAKDDKEGTAMEYVAGLVMIVAVPAGALGLIGFLLGLCYPRWAGVGLTLLNFAIPALAFALVIGEFTPRGSMLWRRIVAVPLGVAVAASVLAFMWGLTGAAVRLIAPADYYGRYGDRVVAAVDPDRCRLDGPVKRRGFQPEMACSEATWTLDGVEHSGKIYITREENRVLNPYDGERPVDPTLEAYVMGNDGYSYERVGEVESWAEWGGQPLWLLAIGAPATVVTVYLRIALGRLPASRKSETQ